MNNIYYSNILPYFKLSKVKMKIKAANILQIMRKYLQWQLF